MVKKKYESGFDSATFMDSIYQVSGRIVDELNRANVNDRTANPWEFTLESSFGNNDEKTIEFKSRPREGWFEKIIDKLKKSKDNSIRVDNKSSFNDIINAVNNYVKEYKDYLKVITLWECPGPKKVEVKTGLFSKKLLIYREHTLSIKFKVIYQEGYRQGGELNYGNPMG